MTDAPADRRGRRAGRWRRWRRWPAVPLAAGAASLGDRGFARFVDGLVASFAAVAGTFLLWVNGVHLSESAGGGANTVLASLVVAVPTAIWGRSLGKDSARADGVEVQRTDGRPAGMAALAREAVFAAPLLIGMIPAWRWPAFAVIVASAALAALDPRRRALHDRIAGTVVVRRPGPA